MIDYLDLADLLRAADFAMAPQRPLVRDVGLLESALARPQATVFGADAYSSIWEKAAALMESTARNRALIDGDKRLAWVATRLFLTLNDIEISAPSQAGIDDFVRQVAQGHLDLAAVAAQLEDWLEDCG